MPIFNNLFKQKYALIDQKKESFNEIASKWNDFLKLDTYLIAEEKSKFLERLNQETKVSNKWIYRIVPDLYKKIEKYSRKIENLKNQINSFNEQFIARRLKEHDSFFEGKDDGIKFSSTIEQRIAIIKDDKHNLVVAGAGSGKTSVLTSRIAYLIRRKDKIDKEKILALAFTRVAAKEMEDRLKKWYGIEINISTFHSLGYQIIREETGKKPQLLFDGKAKELRELINRIFLGALDEEEFQGLFIEYLAFHIEQDLEDDSFEDKEEYYKYMRNKKYSTLNNIEVKSISERDIGNFLFLHGITFEYEPIVQWVDESEEGKEYRPDFYLPDYNIYIEHWGVNERHEVPSWFTKTTEEYLNLRKWKLSQFEKHHQTLVETWDFERNNEVLIPNLKQNLLKVNPEIKFMPLSYEELIERIHEFKEKRNEVANLLLSFIQIAKSNFYKETDIEQKLKKGKYSKKQQIFGRMALEIYHRYQDYLKKHDKIDFNDMINLAVDFMKKNPQKYINRYEHVLVDEFQDISYQRLQLIKGFVNENSNTKLFCVGDDWQSIYQFTGSDVRFFIYFQDYFPNPEISYLEKNFRSSKKIIEVSNELISKNREQLKKQVQSQKELGNPPSLFELSKKTSYSIKNQIHHVYKLIKLLLSEGIQENELMVLSRFNYILKQLEIKCGADGIATERKVNGMRFYSAHASKGSESEHVIIINITSGLHGFPSEIQDSSVLEVVKRFEAKKYLEEERRLFYVALTRGKKFL
ncbi:MAG: UvrD-helicase domain-containing protein, partial [Promethearchaeota archaeon]